MGRSGNCERQTNYADLGYRPHNIQNAYIMSKNDLAKQNTI